MRGRERLTDRDRDRQTDRQAGRQAGRQACRQSEMANKAETNKRETFEYFFAIYVTDVVKLQNKSI